MLGWDITDFGMGDFDKVGFSLITIRNGNRAMADKYPKVYAEKLLYLKEGQYAPNHFHWFKTEDIINRGGGNVLIRVYNSLPDEEIDYESDVTVHTDGRTCWVKTGVTVNGIEHIEYLPILDQRNASIKLENVTSYDVNKAIQRSITKACGRHGLGLYIYAGEDLPEGEDPEQPRKPEQPPKPASEQLSTASGVSNFSPGCSV